MEGKQFLEYKNNLHGLSFKWQFYITYLYKDTIIFIKYKILYSYSLSVKTVKDIIEHWR